MAFHRKDNELRDMDQAGRELELTMRDVLGGLEELAAIKGLDFQGSVEILGIEPAVPAAAEPPAATVLPFRRTGLRA